MKLKTEMKAVLLRFLSSRSLGVSRAFSRHPKHEVIFIVASNELREMMEGGGGRNAIVIRTHVFINVSLRATISTCFSPANTKQHYKRNRAERRSDFLNGFDFACSWTTSAAGIPFQPAPFSTALWNR